MLIDAGPLVSSCHRDQPRHYECRNLIENAHKPLVTTWACFVEAMFVVRRNGGFAQQMLLWVLLESSLVRLHDHAGSELFRMSALMSQYQNVPMDLADASLVALAEAIDDKRIVTLDKHFHIYRLNDGSAFDVVPIE